ncbi:glycosyltransferase family 2 protein [Anaerococcus hydrogenalis]|uniref:glycosyltransferase family 2 protein n=1 Tax=Anaerococcus hydrogenalis TaxID=33029 RepID=UPI002903600A|nr:glycosyltransferase family 2 protein [Anaerococcus hydrogenalis]MDU1316074.1 glycosyltransferase family 2 protein [Anaerococcus hydrogenalis]
MEKKLTIIIPVYNRENTIEQTIESIENQSCKDFEILTIDDGSVDNSKKVIEKLINKYRNIRYIYQENSGVSSARNNGIKNAKTKYISFLDSDDFYEKRFVEKMIDSIEKNNSDICCCGYYIKKNNKKRKVKTLFRNRNVLLNYILGNNKFHTSSFVFRRDFIVNNDIYFDKDLSWGEDIYFFIKALSKTRKINLVEDYLSTYISGEDENALSVFSIEKIYDDEKFVKKIILDSDIKLNNEEKKALINNRYVGLLIYRLLQALDMGYDKKIVKDYYTKFYSDIHNLSFSFGIRSLKLYFNTKKLERKLNG